MEKGVQVEDWEDEDAHEGPTGRRAADGNWEEETQDDTR